MRKRKLATLIGAFVIGAIILLFAVIVSIFPQRRLDRRHTYVVYFSGSVQGLREGSSLTYRGLVVGKVVNMTMQYDKLERKFVIPILVKFGRDITSKIEHITTIDKLIQRGFSAKLVADNLILSSAHIELIFKPDSGVLYHNITPYTQIPSISEPPGEDIDAVLKAAKKALNSVAHLLNSPQVKQLVSDTGKMMNSGKKLLNNINHNISPSMYELDELLKQLNSMAYSMRVLTEYLSRQPQSLVWGKPKPKKTRK